MYMQKTSTLWRYVFLTKSVLKSFENKASKYFDTIESFSNSKFVILTEARDRLLPKLMSGEIEFGH